MTAAHARIIALYMLRLGLTVRDGAVLFRAHPRAIKALLVTR